MADATALEEGEVFEMANLSEARTGIPAWSGFRRAAPVDRELSISKALAAISRNEGDRWMDEEVTAFKDALHRLP